MFNLPYPLSTLSLALSFLLYICRSFTSATSNPTAESIAAANGPSEAECTSHTPDGQTYGPSILARAQLKPPGAWIERIRIYRERLGTGRWTPNENTKPYAADPASKNGMEGMKGEFNYPMTVIFGLEDLAFDLGIVLDGIEGYFLPPAGATESEISASRSRQSQIIRLPGQSHWFFVHKDGAEVVAKTLVYLLGSSRSGEGMHGRSASWGLDDVFEREIEQGGVELATYA